jgi:hypothetical protein
MRYSVANSCGDSRPQLRFSIFAVLAVVTALILFGCAGAVGASNPSTIKTSSTLLVSTTDALPTGTVNEAYAANFTAQGGVQPYHWNLALGQLPAGIALAAASGAVQGMPSAAGTSSFVAKVTDSSPSPQTSSQDLTLTISEPANPLRVTSTSVPVGYVGSSYSATLQATGGTAPYTWNLVYPKIPGLTLSADGVISGVPTFSSTYSFGVTVQDSSSPKNTAGRVLTMLIYAGPSALEITTASLATGKEGTAYSATLSASGGKPGYTWSVASGKLPAGLTLAADGIISGTPSKTGTASFTAEVQDSSNPKRTAEKGFSLTVGPGTSAPPLVITTTSLAEATENMVYSDTLTASGGTKPYTWTKTGGRLPAGVTLGTSGILSGAPTASGTFLVVVQVRDASNPEETASKHLTLVVTAPTSALTITTASIANGRVNAAYSSTLAASGGKAPYSWSMASGALPTGLTLSTSGVISGTPKKSGTYTIMSKVTDSETPAETASKQFTFSVSAAATTTLAISSTTVPAGKINTAYSMTLAAAGGTAPYAWSMPSGALPTGLTLSGAGVISGTPKTSGSFTFMSEVTDSENPAQTATKQFILSVSAAATTTLAISTTTVPAGKVNTAYSMTFAATGGTTPYSWSMPSGALPTGLTLSAAGVISGTPKTSGSFTFMSEVADSENPAQTATKQFTFSVSTAAATLAVSTTAVPAGKLNTAYTMTFAATGGTTPYSWSMPSGALPTGLTLSGAGVISGTPKASGSFTFMSEVTDSETPAQTATKQFTFSVSAAPTSTLAISTATVPAGKINAAYSATLAATGGTTPYTWSLAAGALPKGLSLSSAGGISGTPTASGTFTFAAEVTDSSAPVQTAQMTYSLTISAAATTPLSITTASLASAKVGTAYAATLGATGGTTPYKWSITSGTLNKGLSLSSAGAISGTPTAAGTASFTVQVTDSSAPALTATQTLSLVIASNTSTLAISTTSLADGQVGGSYSATATATGGTTPYTWSLASGTLPAGLTLGGSTGTISGTPTASGTSSFTLKVTDSSSPAQTASQAYSIVISAAASGTNVTACGTLANTGSTYVLQNDVSSSGSCFSIQASNVTFNLNGHTVTYNTSSQSVATYGISGVACWDTSNPAGNPCGGTFDGFTVYGGTITEGSGSSGSFSHCIRMGQGINSGPTIHDITFTFQTDSAMGIYIDYAGSSVPGGAIIYNNTFHNNVTSVQSRYDIDGASIRLDQGQATTTGAQVYDNTILGGPQGGILDETLGGGAVYGNTISQGTVGSNQYTNDFAIYAWEENINVHNNTITPSQGRGISIDATSYPVNGTIAQSNTVTVTESNDNSEYGGCPLDGTYGIQYDDEAASASDQSNTVVANAKQCDGAGLRLTAVGTGDTSLNNSYSGKLVSGFASGVVATGLSIDSGGQPAVTATRDTFVGDTSSIFVDWDGAGPFTCISCTLGSGPTPTSYTTFDFWNGGTPVTPGGMHFRDTTFTGSASKTSTTMTVPGSNGQTAEYWIDWTYTVTVEDGSGAAVSGASVSITDALGNNVFSGTTNSSGQATAVLTEFRMYNSGSSAVQEMRTPDAVSISASGCTTLNYSTTISGTTSETRSMTGTCN